MEAANRAQPIADPWRPLVRAHDEWLGLPTTLERLLGGGEEIAGFYLPDPMLAIARSGSGTRSYTSGRRTQRLFTAPRMIELAGAGYQIDHAQWDGTPGEVIMVKFPAATINRLLRGTGKPFDLSTRHELFDEGLAELAFSLWSEAANGSPRGPLYVEGMTLALIGLLSTQYGALGVPASRRLPRFSPKERVRVREFIMAELSGSLCVERLAQVAGMSPDHFSRVFKATFGLSPHSYVVERRLEFACKALRREPDRSVADVAVQCGFSSQSHFTEAFGRKVGTTPARWRSAR